MAEATTENTTAADSGTLLEVNNLVKHFPIQKGFLKRTVGNVRAVDDVSFSVTQGKTLGLVGESGCGKTTTSRCILRAIDPTSGQILFRKEDGEWCVVHAHFSEASASARPGGI